MAKPTKCNPFKWNKMKKKPKKKSTKPKKVYPRVILDPQTEQFQWVRKMVQDQLFMKLLESENRIYYNIVKSTWDNMSYSSAPIVKRNLQTACVKYKVYNNILG